MRQLSHHHSPRHARSRPRTPPWVWQRLVGLRLLLARRPRIYWAAAVTCAVIAGGVFARSTARLESARAAWGDTRRVAVVRTATPAGSTPEVEVRELPRALLPDTALTELPAGTVAAHDLDPGEVLTAHDLVSPQVAGGVTLAVPARGAPDLAIGQTALLLTVDGTRCEGPVMARDDEWLDVAVPDRCATSVALAVLAGDLVVASVGA